MRLKIALSIILAIPFFSFSQITIQGLVKTEKNKPISDTSITLTEINGNAVIAYDISNSEGKYLISYTSTAVQLQLEIRSMGYKNVVKIIENKTQILNFTLTETVTKLKEVILKNDPITRKGDTISYSVNSFSKKEDRTIADVLKNMPGIEVLANGKILYQGKAINKYYIEGLDLLEGKYNLANSNLPYKEVSKVQILENHQSIKLLDSLVYSDQAAINIKLKKSYTATGQIEAGAGFSPLLWDLNFTPMVFSKKQQMITSYQTNNTGDNVANQLEALTIDEILEKFERNDQKQDWLAIQPLQTPNFSEQRWLDNTIHLITTNYLQKLKKGYELRVNVSYLNDYQQQNGFTDIQFFTANGTIPLFENKYNQLYMSALETNLTLQKNTDKNFLKNSLQFKGFWDSQRGTIQSNNSNILQNLDNQYFNFSNDLKTLFPLGKQIAVLNSYVGFNHTPQSLEVNPGQFNELLNDGNTYNSVRQDIDLKTFYTNNSLGFSKGFNAFSFSPKVGFQFEKQHLDSRINTFTTQLSNDALKNDLDWTRSKLYVHIESQYRKKKLLVELTAPINFHNYQLEDEHLQKGETLNRLTFEPRLSINYDLNSYWSLGVSGNLRNQFGTINQVYYAYILQNYRNIQRIDAPLPQTQNISFAGSVGYRNPLKSFFLNLIYSNSTAENNLLFDNQILPNSASEIQAIEQNNKRYSHNVRAKINKYFSDFNSNVTFSTNYSIQDFQQIINSEITDISNRNWQFNLKVDTDITSWLNTELESNLRLSNNEIQGNKNQTIRQQFHTFALNIFPSERQYIALKSEYINNNLFSERAENIFTDILYRYTWKKKRIDFEIQWNNIFGTDNYRTINIDSFSYIETNFNLRPSQVLCKVRFSL